MPNLRLSYLYRDAGNYKQRGEVILSNRGGLDVAEVRRRLFGMCIEGDYFDPIVWGIPVLFANVYDPELDHEWHELVGLEETNDGATGGDVVDLLS